MRKIFVILSISLSLCAISVQAQSVDSIQTNIVPDTIVHYFGESNEQPSVLPDDTIHGGNHRKNTNSAKRNRSHINSLSTSGIELSSENPIEKVSVTDSVLRKKHSPTVAGCLSIIPGAGQIYNKKYWKLPIVYVSLGISSYFLFDFAHKMTQYKKEFINRRDGNISLLRPEYAIYSDENILASKNTYRRRMEIAIAVTAILYVLNIVDAVVDAHLFFFDISDDLSMRVTPQINQNYYNSLVYQPNQTRFNYGMNLTLNFK